MANALTPSQMQGVGDMSMLTFRGDPALIQTTGALTSALAMAEADALRQQRELLIQYGDPALTEQVLDQWDRRHQPQSRGRGLKPLDILALQRGQQAGQAGGPPRSNAGDIEATRNNPFSILKQLAHQHDLDQFQVNEEMNNNNMFYSSSRAKALGEEGRSYLLDQYNARLQMESALNQILQSLQSQRGSSYSNMAGGILSAQAGAFGG